MKRILAFYFIIPTLLVAHEKDSVGLYYSTYIQAQEMSTNLKILASDEYEGRETGKKGQKMAAQYIADKFQSYGIPPYKEDTYYQQFTFIPKNDGYVQDAIVTVGKEQFTLEQDYWLLKGKGSYQFDLNPVLFLGYGIDDAVYSDYIDVDVTNKILLILAGEPILKDSTFLITKNRTESEWSTFYKKKIATAYKKGAAAILIVDPNYKLNLNEIKSRSPIVILEKHAYELPVLYISSRMANAILKKYTIDQLKAKIDRRSKPIHNYSREQVSIQIKSKAIPAQSENILGYIEGSDLKNEVVVISARYDHLGKEGNLIYNGADDNGSGTVAIMNLAKVFAKAKKEGKGPRRSLLFIAFTGEEKGLLGSNYYIEHPEFPLSQTVCDLNIDMIGRLDQKHIQDPNYIYVIGSNKLSQELHTINENMNALYCNLDLDYTYNTEQDKNHFYYRSDHYNFAKNGIPIIFYFNGTHEDYHKETDEVEKIDFDKMEKISRLVFFTAWEIANKTDRLVLDEKKK